MPSHICSMNACIGARAFCAFVHKLSAHVTSICLCLCALRPQSMAYFCIFIQIELRRTQKELCFRHVCVCVCVLDDVGGRSHVVFVQRVESSRQLRQHTRTHHQRNGAV